MSRNTLALLATVISFGVSSAFLLSLVPKDETGEAISSLEAIELASVAPTSGNDPSASEAVAPAPPELDAVRPIVVRVEKEGRARDIAVEDIYAVRANSHYCYVHDGDCEYFCNQSISALETILDPDRFLRVHRSHIIRLSRVARVKRVGEAAVVELGAPVRCSIPVARGQYREIRERLGMLSLSHDDVSREVGQQD